MVQNEFYSQAVHGPYEVFNLGDLVLEDGGALRQCDLAYATFGNLNETRDNAVLVPTWFSGTNKIIEHMWGSDAHWIPRNISSWWSIR